MATGACNCGAIRFEVSEDLTDVIVCHCSICRKATGSSGIAVIVVATDKFSWLEGEALICTWRKPDADWAMSFCRNCGSPVPGANDAKQTFIPAGLISEGGGDLTVAHHIWVDSKATWDELGDGGRRHRQAFEG